MCIQFQPASGGGAQRSCGGGAAAGGGAGTSRLRRAADAAAALGFPAGNVGDRASCAASSSAPPAAPPAVPRLSRERCGDSGPPGKPVTPRRSGGEGDREKMATPGSEPQAFAPALSVTALHPHIHQHHQHHGSTGGAGFNLPLNRGLERALEEAANSGGLNLSARKLKEFPRTAAPGHDLSDTVQAGEPGPGLPTRVWGCRAFPPGPSVLLDWLGRSGFCNVRVVVVAGTVARLARRPATVVQERRDAPRSRAWRAGSGGSQATASESGTRTRSWTSTWKHSASWWVGKPRQRWPALGQPCPLLVVSRPRPPRRAARPWLAAAREAVPALVLRLCGQEAGVWLSTHTFSLHRGSPVLTNPVFAGALEGKRGVVNEK